MTLARVNLFATDAKGNVVLDPIVRVQRMSPGFPHVPLFADREGNEPLPSNPTPPGTFPDGMIAFHAAGGAYRITVTSLSRPGFERVLPYHAIGTMAEHDFEEVQSGLLINATGTLAERDSFDGQDPGFTFFATDADLLYIRLNAGGWSDGITVRGDPGRGGGMPMLFSDSTNTAEDPGVGYFALNHATLSEVTEIAISDFSAANTNPLVEDLLLRWDQSTNPVRAVLYVQKNGEPETFFYLEITGLIAETGFKRFAVQNVIGSGTIVDNDPLSIMFAPVGNSGDITLVGTSTNSLMIGLGERVFTTQPYLGFANNRIRAVSAANPLTHWMEGVAVYSGTTLTMQVDRVGPGAGDTRDDWTLSLTGEPSDIAGTDPGYLLTFETDTSAPPSAGGIRFNNADLAAATECYVSKATRVGSSIAARLADLFDPARTVKDAFALTNPVDDKQASFIVNGLADETGYVTLAIGGHAGETSFPAGPISLQPNRAGQDGAAAGLDYAWSTDTSGDPGAGHVLANDADLNAATQINISKTDRNGSDMGAVIGTWADSTNLTGKGTLGIKGRTHPNQFVEAKVLNLADEDTYWAVTIEVVGTGAPPDADAIMSVVFLRTGDKGSDGEMSGPETSVAGNLAVFDDETGNKVDDSGTHIDDVLTTGDLGEDEHVFEATEGAILTAGLIESASAYASMAETGASPTLSLTQNVDWNLFINAAVTLTDDRLVDNPVNGQPGTHRSFLFAGSNGTPRTVTWDTQFGGSVPVLNDITDAKWVKVTIECITPSHFIIVGISDASPP